MRAEAQLALEALRRRLVIGGASVGTAVWWTMRPATPRVLRTEVTTAGATALNISGFDRDLAITPDGSRVVYRSNNQLLVRALEESGNDVADLAAARAQLQQALLRIRVAERRHREGPRHRA